MSVKWWADEDVEASARPWAWPFILDAIKAGDGVASLRALSDARLIRIAGLDGVVRENGISTLKAFVDVGLVVEVEGGFTARSWDEYQREDAAKKERQRRWREKRRLGDVSETSRDVSEASSGRRGDVAETATVQYSTVHNSTDMPSPLADASRAREEDAPDKATATARVVEKWRQAQGTGRGGALMVAPLVVGQLAELVEQHGEAETMAAIDTATASSRGPPTIAYLRAIMAKKGAAASEAKRSGPRAEKLDDWLGGDDDRV